MKHPCNVALALAAIICGSNSAANAENWSCNMDLQKGGKPYKQEWIVSDDKMFVPKGKGYYRVAENNSETLLAFLRIWDDAAKNPRPMNFYVVITKSTGTAIEFHDWDFDWGPLAEKDKTNGPQPEAWMPPSVDSIGHCSLEAPSAR